MLLYYRSIILHAILMQLRYSVTSRSGAVLLFTFIIIVVDVIVILVPTDSSDSQHSKKHITGKSSRRCTPVVVVTSFPILNYKYELTSRRFQSTANSRQRKILNKCFQKQRYRTMTNLNENNDHTIPNSNNSLLQETDKEHQRMQQSQQHYKVVIIGAGISGLQCCNTILELFQKNGTASSNSCNKQITMDDILLVEARSRIGGRIYTTIESATAIDTTTKESYVKQFPLDHGAAWVHGIGPILNNHKTKTGSNDHGGSDNTDHDIPINVTTINERLDFEYRNSMEPIPTNEDKDNNNDDDDKTSQLINPMMYLLQRARSIRNDSTNASDISKINNNDMYQSMFHIQPIVNGNPWMRPRSILHTDNNIALYVAGQKMLYDSKNNTSYNTNDKNNRVIEKALQRHYTILRHVQEIGTKMYQEGNGMDTSTTSLHTVIQNALSLMFPASNDVAADHTSCSSNPHSDDDDDDERMIAAIAPFYMLLLECWYGCEVSALQICEFIEDTSRIADEEDTYYTPEGDFYGPHCTVNHGMNSVLQPLLINGVEDRILLNHEVTKIEYRNSNDGSDIESKELSDTNCIYIETSNGLKMTTDTCVVTIPAGCLKEAVLVQNLFTTTTMNNSTTATPFSNDKFEAISLLKMGSYKKVFLTFNHIFWPIEPPFIGLIRHINNSNNDVIANGNSTGLEDSNGNNSSHELHYKTQSHHPLGNCLLVDNLWAVNGIASFEVVLFGLAGVWSIQKSDDEISSAILEYISDAMSIPIATLHEYYRSCHITRWEEDPYSRGAYSSMALGATERHVEELRRPEWDNRLVFSGEATISEYEGSVYAAMYSGMNAAKSIYHYFS